MRLYAAGLIVALAVTGCASSGQRHAAGGGASEGTTSGPVMGGTASPSAPSGTPSSPPSSPPSSSVSCPTDLNFDQPNGPSAQALPSKITVSWVLRCSIVSRGAKRVLNVERSDSDATNLVDALRVPSGHKIKGVCPMYRAAVPYFALVQPDGSALAPKVPVTNCGQAQPEVLQALNALTFKVISTKPLP